MWSWRRELNPRPSDYKSEPILQAVDETQSGPDFRVSSDGNLARSEQDSEQVQNRGSLFRPGTPVAIPLTRGFRALIDAGDRERVNRIKWRVRIDKDGRPYAIAHRPGSGKHGKELAMHRFVVDALPGQIVDHRDGDTLNNRRNNLRKCHNTQNVRNQRPHVNKRTSKLKGVSFDRSRGTFRAQIMANRRKINLGNFVDEISAAKAYDRAALQYFGEFARCNFPIGEVMP
jgi:hypothetical protein